ARKIPFAIEKVSGIASIAKKAGIAVSIWSQAIFPTLLIIMAPITTRAGAVAADGIAPTTGAKTGASKNRIATTNAVRPVRPPSEIPAELSMYVVTVGVPKIAPAIVPMESA